MRLAVVATLMASLLVQAFFLAGCSRRSLGPAGVEAHRIVSVAPATTEALFAIGAGDRVVGRSRFCDWPAEAARLPVVGGVIDADLEAILQLEPELVVGAPGPSSTRLAAQLGTRRIATWFPEVGSFAAIDAMIDGMGDRTHRGPEARAVSAQVDDETRAVERAVAGDASPRVLMVLGLTPPVAAGPNDFVDEMVRRAHATNVLKVGGPWQTLDFEQILQLDPDVVVDASVADTRAASSITPQSPGWGALRAVRGGHVVPVGDGRVLRPGPRVAQGLAVLAHALHPTATIPVW